MYEHLLDVLNGIQGDGYEVELRFALEHRYFDVARRWFDQGDGEGPEEATVQYCDHDDMRCVNGKWENKRTLDCARVRVMGELRAKISISKEVPAIEPADVRMYNLVRHRKRWSYTVGRWRVDWTTAADYCNVEIEWLGSEPSLLCRDPQMDNLREPLMRLLPCIAFSGFPEAHVEVRDHNVFVKPYWSIGLRRRDEVMACLRAQQPLSLTRELLPGCMSHMVSIKYDGIRCTAILMQMDGIWTCVSFGRLTNRNRAAYLPCQECTRPMILDGELLDDGQFIAFDLISLDERMLQNCTFSERIRLLERTEMPTILNKKVKIKQFWPASAVDEALQEMSRVDSDGLVFHNSHGALKQRDTMYKWKPAHQHTVDLRLDEKGTLRTRKNKIQSLDPEYTGAVQPGQIWEFQFQDHTRKLKPVRHRTDKDLPNADKTYRDVRKAFTDKITEEELCDVLT